MRIHPTPAVVGSVAALLIAAAPASADTFAVDNTSDANLTSCSSLPNDCTLRGALNDASVIAGPSTITLPAKRISISSPLPDIGVALTIQGAGARKSIIDGTHSVGTVLSSPVGPGVTLENLEVTGARRTTGNLDAAVNEPALLDRVAVVGNQSIGVETLNTTIVDSVIARNTGEGVGGVEALGSTSISDSTIADNIAALSGHEPLIGPMVWSGGVANIAGLLEIDHSTIAGNDIAPGAELLGGTNLGTLALLDPSTVVRSSVIGASAAPNCGGPIDSNGHNVVADGSCRFTSAGDRSNVDPLLAPLANNGGTTDTMALLAGSPAIDAGDLCPATDQRGQPRDQGTTCDAGAFESSFTAMASLPGAGTPTPTPTTSMTTQTASPPRGATAPRLTISGIGKMVTRKALAAGLRIHLRADEPITAAVALLVGWHRGAITRLHDLALAKISLTDAASTRTVKLRAKRIPRGTRRMRAELFVLAYDRAGNRTAERVTFTIR
jgi:hypothetical protein